MKRLRLLFLVSFMPIGLSITATSGTAQEIEETDVQGWFQYEFQRRLRERLRGSWDLGYRQLLSTEDRLGQWSRLHMRGSLVNAHSKRVSFEGGIGGYYTFSENLTDQFELRAWQGAIVFWPVAKLFGREADLRHRFRLEQRWINLRDLDDTEFGVRFRYRLATFIPLNRPAIESKAWYIPLMGEGFADLGGDSPEFFAARLRLTAGVGHVLSDNWTLEFRYTAQKSRDTVLDRFTTTDSIFDFRVRTAVPIKDLFRPSR